MSQIQFKNGNTVQMTTTMSYDYLNRLLSISSSSSASASCSFSYSYNDANQRAACRLADGSYWVYLYDTLGQVISGKKYFPDGTPVPGQQFEYAFDDTGNRTSTKAGGDQNGSNLRSANYTANNLNQYTSRDVPAALDIIGVVLATSTVLVNNNSPYRHVEYYRHQLSIDNSSTAVWQSVTNTATSQASVIGNVFLQKTPEPFTYDADGNLLTDGRWNYTLDAENRLISMSAISTVPTAAKLKLDFEYDWRSRRIRKDVSIWDTGTSSYQLSTRTKFVYDNWNLIAILNSSSAVLQSFLWGSDLSGTARAAGGVGGLLAMADSTQGANFVKIDGNGNISALVKAADGTMSAAYEYGPFGEALRMTGAAAKSNPLRFSTKFRDDESDLLYDGRPYNPATASWQTREPADQDSGSAYVFRNNDPADPYNWADSNSKENYHLSYETAALVPGYCGSFSWKIKWHVSRTKKAPRQDDLQGGWIYQHVVIHYSRVRICGEKPEPRKDQDHYEAFIWYPGKTDTWVQGTELGGTRGKIIITGRAFYTRDASPSADQGWFPTPPGSESDYEGSASSKVPIRNSNEVNRKLTAKWKCCPERQLTELDP